MDRRPQCFRRLVQLWVCLSFATLSSSAGPPASLKFVSVLYRHGDRSPEKIYPKDQHQVPGAWPDGLGWLTNTGKQQHYMLGKYLSDRYGGFINTERYQHDEIKIEASGFHRCLMSAYSNLAGLFPPRGEQKWKLDMPWQPIPVQTTPRETDNKLAMLAKCPRYDELLTEVLSSPPIVREEDANEDFYDMISRETGVEKVNIREIWPITDALICERAHNLPVNNWANAAGVWDKVNNLTTWNFDLLYSEPEMAKLTGGPLLGEIVNNMAAASNQTDSMTMPKLYMYSAHDTTVAALLNAMQVWSSHQPPYAAVVMVELHRVGQGHEVKVYYRNDTDREPLQLTPPGCGNPCTLDEFVKVARQRIPTDWDSECQVEGSSQMKISIASLVSLLVGLGLSVVVIMGLGVWLLRLRAKRREIYSRL